MADYCAERGVSLAPHGKTTMAPAIFRRQLEAGAWAMTLATAWQARVAAASGVPRILLANEVVDAGSIDWLASTLDDGPEVYCWIDFFGRHRAARSQARRSISPAAGAHRDRHLGRAGRGARLRGGHRVGSASRRVSHRAPCRGDLLRGHRRGRHGCGAPGRCRRPHRTGTSRGDGGRGRRDVRRRHGDHPQRRRQPLHRRRRRRPERAARDAPAASRGAAQRLHRHPRPRHLRPDVAVRIARAARLAAASSGAGGLGASGLDA